MNTNKITKDYLNSLIGKTKEDAIKICIDDKYNYRIIREDDTNYMVTCDFQFYRINFEIDNNLISDATIG